MSSADCSSRPAARIDANPRVVGASAGALKYSRTRSRSRGVDVQEQRRLALGHRLHRRLFEVGRQRRQFVGELQQQLQLVLALHFGEVRHHLGQRGGHDSSGRYGSPGSSPAAIGHPHGVAPLGPRAVVVAHARHAEQMGQHEPGVAGPLADAAVDDRLVVRAA